MTDPTSTASLRTAWPVLTSADQDISAKSPSKASWRIASRPDAPPGGALPLINEAAFVATLAAQLQSPRESLVLAIPPFDPRTRSGADGTGIIRWQDGSSSLLSEFVRRLVLNPLILKASDDGTRVGQGFTIVASGASRISPQTWQKIANDADIRLNVTDASLTGRVTTRTYTPNGDRRY